LSRIARHITKSMMLTPRQLASAIALLGWSADDLEKASGVSRHTLYAFLSRDTNPRLDTVQAWIGALHRHGIIFQDEDDAAGPGVRLRKGVSFPVVPMPPPGAKAKGKGRAKA
jgi:transcriptional regulator with XRE-family HTH domain